MKIRLFVFVNLFIFLFYFFGLPQIQAQSTDEIKAKINQKTDEIKNLEKEISGYQKQIDELSGQVVSLSSTIKSLELTQKKLEADIKITENKIVVKNQEISRLNTQISDKEENIADNKRFVSYSLSLINQASNQSIQEMLISSQSLSDAWNSLDEIGLVQAGLIERILEIKMAKASLENNKRSTEKAKSELIKLQSQLKDQRQIVINTSAEKNTLLKDTKKSEAQYQKLLVEKKSLKEDFEREVFSYESQLRLLIDASLLPHTGSGVLAWPLSSVRITQYFGNTSFSTANPQIYNGKGHTGIDLGASIGTPVKAALHGIVTGVGNTDLVRGCYSYGKWIMIKHPNGLSTLYAHLSLQTVAVGNEVSIGNVIGYSGNTGYSTGPHLHFGVYATQGVEIKSVQNSKSCRGAIIPLADFKAYLNPMSYL